MPCSYAGQAESSLSSLRQNPWEMGPLGSSYICVRHTRTQLWGTIIRESTGRAPSEDLSVAAQLRQQCCDHRSTVSLLLQCLVYLRMHTAAESLPAYGYDFLTSKKSSWRHARAWCSLEVKRMAFFLTTCLWAQVERREPQGLMPRTPPSSREGSGRLWAQSSDSLTLEPTRRVKTVIWVFLVP